ncbi:hypothetical protein ACFO5R_17995 [Halosolutus amylolyticus]|uniref:DUF7344 domain-containing protein n=1 Tax=Halosolutus amylolyticus TaxID=2932267 RepID=A0ABD5PTK0_9EURY|nr:hypothetical protein [Halosolutus amylolyticus]
MSGKDGAGEADPDRATIDHGFVALRNQERRYALYFLLEQETASVAELADVVVGWMGASTNGMATRRERDRAYRTLVHQHVPVLVEFGIVDYDGGTKTVSMTPCPDAIREFVHLACLAETGA